MRTAIDTNILSALFSGEPAAHVLATRLEQAKGEGGLALAPAVYAELLAYPGMTQTFLENFLTTTGITVDFALEPAIWREAGIRFARYAQRRRTSDTSSNDSTPKRLLADFLIGAHALGQADRLFTLDPARYQLDFPELHLL